MLDIGPAAKLNEIEEHGAICLRDKIKRTLRTADTGRSSAMPDRRTASVVRVRKCARVYRDGTDEGIDCVVRNLSVMGAQIELPASTGLSDDIVLFLAKENAHIPARVIWQDGQQIGLRFSNPLGWHVRNNSA